MRDKTLFLRVASKGNSGLALLQSTKNSLRGMFFATYQFSKVASCDKICVWHVTRACLSSGLVCL